MFPKVGDVIYIYKEQQYSPISNSFGIVTKVEDNLCFDVRVFKNEQLIENGWCLDEEDEYIILSDIEKEFVNGLFT